MIGNDVAELFLELGQQKTFNKIRNTKHLHTRAIFQSRKPSQLGLKAPNTARGAKNEPRNEGVHERLTRTSTMARYGVICSPPETRNRPKILHEKSF